MQHLPLPTLVSLERRVIVDCTRISVKQLRASNLFNQLADGVLIAMTGLDVQAVFLPLYEEPSFYSVPTCAHPFLWFDCGRGMVHLSVQVLGRLGCNYCAPDFWCLENELCPMLARKPAI